MLIHVQDIEKNYGSLTLFEKLSLKIPQGHKIGLVGDNGSGKSSLFKLILGKETVSNGQVIRKKDLAMGYLEQLPQVAEGVTVEQVIEASFADLLKCRQQLQDLEAKMAGGVAESAELLAKYGVLQDQFIQQGDYELNYRIEKMATGLGIQHLLLKPFNQLSGGEQTKVGLAKVLLQEPELLLLDEPTNHLDLNAIEWLESYLQDYQGTLLTISHDRRFLDQVVNEIYELEDGEIQVYQGNYSAYVDLKEKRLAKEMLDFQEQQKKIKKLEDAIRRYRQWGNESGNEDLFKKAKSLEKRLARIQQLKRPILEKEQIKLRLDVKQRSGKQVVKIEKLSMSFPDKTLFQEMDFQLLWPKHVGVVGENGVGKSTLIKLILQELQPDCGKVELGEQVKIGYLPQKIEFKDETLSIIEAFRADIGMEEGEARGFLARFLFYGGEVFRLVKNLSGGERMRLKLAILMKQDTNLLILDEPTNHLDIATREVVEEVLADYLGTVLAVSHDRYFLDKLFAEILWLMPEEKPVLYAGNYQWAREKQLQNASQTMTEPQKTTRQTNNKFSVKAKQKTVKKASRLSISQVEADLAEQNQQLSRIDVELSQETDFMILADLVKERDQVVVKINQLETTWLELME